jgi:UDP-glucose 4-epimerase
MHVLVTGGAGFIGSHLVEALLSRGDVVVVVDDFSSGSKNNLPASDRLRVIKFQLGLDFPPDIGKSTFDAVVHLAGLPSVSASWERPTEAHERNLTTTISLVGLCCQLKIPRFVFASSAAVYGLPLTLPIPETAHCRPLSPYGLQKLAGEKYLELFCGQKGLSGIALRLFNVYGPRQQPDSAYSGVISIFAEAFKKKKPLKLYGDGKQTRDFVFVSDVVDAICASLDVPMPGGHSLTLNIGTGIRSSLLDVIAALRCSFLERAPNVIHAEAQAGDIPHSQPDISAAIRELGIRPRLSLEKGLRLLLDSL